MPRPVPRVDRIGVVYSSARSLLYPWFLRSHPSRGEYPFGRFLPNLHRVTVSFCKTSESSFGVRQFIENDLVDYSRQNACVSVYVECRRHRRPLLTGEYGNGRRAIVDVDGMDRVQIGQHMANLRTRSGEKITHFERDQSSKCPSVQGRWHPLLHLETALNVAVMPDAVLAKHRSPLVSATDAILNKMNNHNNNQVHIIDDGHTP